MLNIECAVLMGANIASEVAKEDFCEATIGKFEMVSVAHVKQYTGFCEYLNLSSTAPKFTKPSGYQNIFVVYFQCIFSKAVPSALLM